ncbi:MAG: hypothetical protein PHQ94_00470 [Syntrophomonas sp.]|nr:hypothetical protein [Syntrophomonas sp.]
MKMINNMVDNMMDYKESITEKYTQDGKADPGRFSFMEPGWWGLHAAAITGIYWLGRKLRNR